MILKSTPKLFAMGGILLGLADLSGYDFDVDLTLRERRLAIGFYCGTSLATILWWAALTWLPESRVHFLGREFSNRWLWILLVPDLISALVMSTIMVWFLVRRLPLASALAWVHFGSQGYAWAISIGLAIIDPAAYWGVVAMTFSAGGSLAFAMRLQNLDILWGAFQFKRAGAATPQAYWRQTLAQTAAMWLIFLVAIPFGIFLIEGSLGWDRHHFIGTSGVVAGIMIFVMGGSLGLYAARTMTKLGEGTPLPSVCAAKLVVAGPYQFIRNPMATGGILQGLAVGLAIGSPLVMMYALLGGLWWDLLARHLEEKFLAAEFGESYRAYAAAVPCWGLRLRPWLE